MLFPFANRQLRDYPRLYEGQGFEGESKLMRRLKKLLTWQDILLAAVKIASSFSGLRNGGHQSRISQGYIWPPWEGMAGLG